MKIVPRIDLKEFDLMKLQAPGMNEVACLGHALDGLSDSLRARMRPTIRIAHQEGMLHLIPLSSNQTDDIRMLTICEQMNDGSFQFEQYIEPRFTILFQLRFPEQIPKKSSWIAKKNDEEMWKLFSQAEKPFEEESATRFREGLKWTVVANYKREVALCIYEFAGDRLASDFVLQTEKLGEKKALQTPFARKISHTTYEGQDLLCYEMFVNEIVRLGELLPPDLLKDSYICHCYWRHRNLFTHFSIAETNVDRSRGDLFLDAFISNHERLL